MGGNQPMMLVTDNRELVAEDTRKALEKWLPREHWGTITQVLVGWGQVVCTPRFPKCHECAVSKLCPAAFTEESMAQKKRRLSQSQDREGSLADLEDAVPQFQVLGKKRGHRDLEPSPDPTERRHKKPRK